MAVGSTARPGVRTLCWLAGLTTTIAGLHTLGRGVLAAPSAAPTAWPDWWQTTDPIVGSVTLLRLLAVGLGWYLLLVTLVTLLAAVAGSVRLRRVATRVTLRPLRDLVASLVLVSVTTAPVAATPPLGAGGVPVPVQIVTTPDQVAVGVHADPPPSWRPHPHGGELRLDRPATSDPPTRGPDGAPSAPAGAVAPTEGAQEAGTTAPTVHVVRPGESFWRIARAHLEEHGRPTDDGAVATYWRRLVEANRDRLVVPGDADLILPGQRFVLPPLSPPGSLSPGTQGAR